MMHTNGVYRDATKNEKKKERNYLITNETLIQLKLTEQI